MQAFKELGKLLEKKIEILSMSPRFTIFSPYFAILVFPEIHITEIPLTQPVKQYTHLPWTVPSTAPRRSSRGAARCRRSSSGAAWWRFCSPAPKPGCHRCRWWSAGTRQSRWRCRLRYPTLGHPIWERGRDDIVWLECVIWLRDCVWKYLPTDKECRQYRNPSSCQYGPRVLISNH